MSKYPTFTFRRKGTELKSSILLKHKGKESSGKRQCPMTRFLHSVWNTRTRSVCLATPFTFQDLFLGPRCQVQVDTLL